MWSPCYTLSSYTLGKKANLNNLIHGGGGGGGVGSTWGDNLFLHGHAEWVETRDLTGQIFDSHLN